MISRLPIRATRALDPRDNLGEESKFISFITDGASSRGVLEYRRCKAERINPQPSVGEGRDGVGGLQTHAEQEGMAYPLGAVGFSAAGVPCGVRCGGQTPPK